jgi:hypothetical protein
MELLAIPRQTFADHATIMSMAILDQGSAGLVHHSPLEVDLIAISVIATLALSNLSTPMACKHATESISIGKVDHGEPAVEHAERVLPVNEDYNTETSIASTMPQELSF